MFYHFGSDVNGETHYIREWEGRDCFTQAYGELLFYQP